MSHDADRPRGDLPARRLSSEEFERVIRRASELQASAAEETGLEGLSEAEVVRIGRELGLSGEHLAQALAEVGGPAEAEAGVMVTLMGGARVAAARGVPGSAEAIARLLETYLVNHEFLVVQRRFADRVTFVRASGIMAAVSRTTSTLIRKSPLLDVPTLDLAVRALEPERCLVRLATDLSGARTGHLLGGATLGGVFGGVGALTLGIAVAPVAALVGVPILAAGLGGMRYAYREAAHKVSEQLEALLDRLEHGELV